MDEKRFCVFILSHGRPNNVVTLRELEASGYQGDWYIVLDNEDESRIQYEERYGAERILVFDKLAISQTFDTADQSDDRRTVVFARNACWDLARKLGYRYFLELDDDYTLFLYRYETGGVLKWVRMPQIHRFFEVMVRFLESTPVATVAMAQGGDFMGGVQSSRWTERFATKAMNTFFLRAEDDWRFVGRLNEDVNAYTVLAQRGHIFLSTMYAQVNQSMTQTNTGGMTEAYLASGTYVKSFTSVMMMPSAVTVGSLGEKYHRLHHQIKWANCIPKIIPESVRKPRGEE